MSGPSSAISGQGRQHIHARNRIEPLNERLIGLHTPNQFLFHPNNLLLDEVQLPHQLAKHPAMVLGNLAPQNLPQLVPLTPQPALGFVSQPVWLLLTRNDSFYDLPPGRSEDIL